MRQLFGAGLTLWLVGVGVAAAQDPGGPIDPAPAQAEGEDGADLVGLGLDPVTRGVFVEAARHEARGSWARAASAYSLVLGREPTYAPAVLGLARARERQGDRRAAEATLRTLPMDADAVEALAALLVEERPAESVSLYRTLGTLRLGDPAPLLFEAEAALRARDVGGSVAALDRYLTFDGASRSPDRVVELMVGLAAAYKDAGDREAAKMWLRRAIEQAPDGALAEEARARLDRVLVEEAADSLALGGAEELDPALTAALDLARRALAEGDPQGAARRLEELASVAPRSPEIWGALGEARLALNDVAGAEQALMTAVALQPDEANWRVSLGRLIALEYAGRRHREAIEELSVALTLRPSWTELRYHLGVLHQESGEGVEANRALEEYLRVAPEGVYAEAARLAITRLTRPRPEAPSVERLSAVPPDGVPPEAWRRYRLAQVYLRDRQDDARALAEIDAALALDPDYTDAINLLARLQLRAGQHDEALATYERSLTMNPNQPQTLLSVGYALQAEGQVAKAAARFREAARVGAPEAWYALAALAEQDGRWMEARELLAEYFARAAGGRDHEAALALRASLERRLRATVGLITGAAGIVLGVPLLILRRRRSGLTLDALLLQHPECYEEVTAALTAMRHEVIKHNTTVLKTVADALDAGDPGPAQEALGRLVAPDGAVARWESSLRALEALGAGLGLRLNLRHLDPALAPMCRAFDALRRQARRARSGRASAAELRRISDALNGEGYRALGRLIREANVRTLDEETLRAAWERVRAEPAFHALAQRGQALPNLTIHTDGMHLPVRASAQELDDIIVNLLRNNLQATLAERGDDARLGLILEEELDPVTGLEEVAMRFCDNARSVLTDEMIQGRYIARGFGIVVERVRRRRGSVRVEPAAAPYNKAIVVRLPRAEREDNP